MAKLKDCSTGADTILDLALQWLFSILHSDQVGNINLDQLKQQILQMEHGRVLILLDGLDEMSCQCQELEQILKKPNFVSMSYPTLITTRPNMISEIKSQLSLV